MLSQQYKQIKRGRKERYNVYQVPYDALRQIVGAKNFLKKEQILEKLDIIAYQYSDNGFAEIMREEERRLFQKIREKDRDDGSQRNHKLILVPFFN